MQVCFDAKITLKSENVVARKSRRTCKARTKWHVRPSMLADQLKIIYGIELRTRNWVMAIEMDVFRSFACRTTCSLDFDQNRKPFKHETAPKWQCYVWLAIYLFIFMLFHFVDTQTALQTFLRHSGQVQGRSESTSISRKQFASELELNRYLFQWNTSWA